MELAREINTNRLADLSLPGSLGDLVNSRISHVGADAEAALLAVASLPDPTVQMVAEATDSSVDDLIEVLGVAETQAVVAIDGNRINFTHPILAHGVYSGANPHRRREMHRRLAELVTEPELRARHLALSDATGQPQPSRPWTRRQRSPAPGAPPPQRPNYWSWRSGWALMTHFAKSAVPHIISPPVIRAARRLRKPRWKTTAGQLRARLHQRPWSACSATTPPKAAAALLQRGLAETEDDLALRVLVRVTLAFARFNAGQLPSALEIGEEAVTDATRLGQPHLLSMTLGMRATMRFLRGDGFDVSSMRHALELEDPEAPAPSAFRPSVQNALMLACTGQLQQAHDEMVAMRQRYLDHGEENELVFIDFHEVLCSVWRGDFAQAATLAESLVERALQSGGDLPLCVGLTARALLAAYLGRVDQAHSDATEALAAGQRSSSRSLSEWPVTVLGFLDVSLGNYAAALTTLQSEVSRIHAAPDGTEIIAASFVPDAVEAMVQLGTSWMRPNG